MNEYKHIQISVFEDFHARIVANWHRSVGLEILVITPSSERLEVVEGQIQRVPSKFSTGFSTTKQIFPEHPLALKPNLLFSVEMEEEREGLEVVAGGLKPSNKVGNADPVLVYLSGLEVASEAVSLELRRQSSLDLSRSNHQVGPNLHFGEFLQLNSHFPLLSLSIESRKHKRLLQITLISETLQLFPIDVSHIPEVRNPSKSNRQDKENEKKGVEVRHFKNINFRHKSKINILKYVKQQFDNMFFLIQLYYARIQFYLIGLLCYVKGVEGDCCEGKELCGCG